MPDAPLLAVEQLSIRTDARPARVLVDSISFEMGIERVGLVGESGSGKSLTARSLMGLLPRGLAMQAARLHFDGEDLRQLSPRQWCRYRGRQLGLVLQDARYSLNPALTVGSQIEEALRLHQNLSGSGRREGALEMMDAVALQDPRRLHGAYPHQLSGGMGQRVMLAIMLVNRPRLLIADEPTSALDAEVREQVLELIAQLAETHHMGLLLISHDLQQVARYCQRTLVMYRGRLVDCCATSALAHSAHPYTSALWRCRPGAASYGHLLPTLDRGWTEGTGA